MNATRLQEIEMHLLLESLRLRHGYDFTQYTRPSLERRLHALAASCGYHNLAPLIPRLLHEEGFVRQVVEHLSVPVTEMFRTPERFREVRMRLIPYLATFPRIQIWVAGCASGEEVYSLAILLHEEGLLDRCTLFATDIHDSMLSVAKEGQYPTDLLARGSRNHLRAGGTGMLTDHFAIHGSIATIDAAIRDKIVFANHNLAADGVFAETQLISCANVLIYFNPDLKNRVLALFQESLVHGGFLCLGTHETLENEETNAPFARMDSYSWIYRCRKPESVTFQQTNPYGCQHHESRTQNFDCR
ncbi:MAG: protein-glutamate O-methyltransferase CheR [Magnetococcales bacterium]|nr:protein-glutamate O-methyltransferase CheR [Magnetococcales bacterium]